MRRPKATTIDPSWLRAGVLGGQTAQYDRQFEREFEAALALVLDHLVERLPDPDRSAVQMCVQAGMSYRQAGEILGHDKKTVWRWCNRGIEQVRVWVTDTPWMQAMLSDRLPADVVQATATMVSTSLDDALGRQGGAPEEVAL